MRSTLGFLKKCLESVGRVAAGLFTIYALKEWIPFGLKYLKMLTGSLLGAYSVEYLTEMASGLFLLYGMATTVSSYHGLLPSLSTLRQ